MDEIKSRFLAGSKRPILYSGFESGVSLLELAGCGVVYLDGSFVTEKPTPGDFDACWEVAGVDDQILDPIFLDFTNARAAQKARFGGEFFPRSSLADGQRDFLEYFQLDKFTGNAKGIVRVRMK